MRRIALLGLLATGCAGYEDLAGDGALKSPIRDDALVGRSDPVNPVLDQSLPPPMPDAAVVTDAAPIAMDAGCRPGERLGPCAICGLDGVPTAPDDDGTCPPIDCGAATTYVIRQQGEAQLCVLVENTPQPSRCKALGECYADPAEYCGETTETEVARAEGVCAVIRGCDGLQGPQVEPQTGQPCNGVGQCQADGTCSAPAECARFVDATTLCAAGNDNGTPYCEFFVQLGFETSCSEYCGRYGTQCLAAWGDRNDTCEHNGGSDCNDRHNDHICRCIAQ